jgi:flagellar hook protein FlgE
MAISNSLNSGVTAIKAFGKGLEVIGDNIANVNTTGFKGSRVTYQDSFSQTFQQASPNPDNSPSIQIGSGTSVASISQQFTQGVLSTTGGPTDLGISGKGFFQVSDPVTTTTKFYTRAGDFRLDDKGFLVTNGGLLVNDPSGASIQITATPEKIASIKVNKDGTIDLAETDGKITPAIKTIGLFSFANPNALKREGDNLLSNASLAAGPNPPPPDATSDIIQGTLELSNVDLTKEFSDLIVAQRSFQAGSRIITVSDSVLEEVVNLKR